jgi:hypothetical protein
MAMPVAFVVVLVPPSGNGRVYEEINTTAWTLACNLALTLYPGHTVETVYEELVKPVGKCGVCGQWQQQFSDAKRRICRDCR